MTKESKKNHKHEVMGIAFLFMGAFSLLSLFSYHHSDPSFFTQLSKSSANVIANYGGKIGANLAEILVQISGLSSFIFSLLCFSFASRLFKGETMPKLVGNFLWIMLAVLSASTFLSLQFDPVTFGGTSIPVGGVLGGFFADSLSHWMNSTGASLFSFCITLTALVFSTPLSAAALFKFSTALLAGLSILSIKAIRHAFILMRDSALIQKQLAKRKIEKEFKQQIEPKIEPKLDLKPKKEATPQKDPPAMDTSSLSSSLKVIDTRSDLKKQPKKEKPAPKQPEHSGNYTLPAADLLNEAPVIEHGIDKDKLQQNSETLAKTLNDFGIEGIVTAVRPGPVITMYEFSPGTGVKVSQIANLSDDIARALSAQSIRIIAPIPGKSVVGVEIPNENRESVFFREIIESDQFQNAHTGIPLAVGKDIAGFGYTSDLSKMPHLLIAGSTGAGKSVFMNSLICSLLYKFTPSDMRMIMVDPKQLELSPYENIPHLLLPVVDDMRKAAIALKWAVNEMEKRYKLMARMGVRNITGFNEKLAIDGRDKVRDLLCPKLPDGMPHANSLSHLVEHDEKGQPKIEKIPYIVVIIDEFADLMVACKNEVESYVLRLAAKARAAGIHLVIATQRPSVDVVTGVLKSNLPSRVAFKVFSKTDSRTILDCNGAEKLIGNGDMLFIPPGVSMTVRLHGAYVSEGEVVKICDHWRTQGQPIFKEEILIDEDENNTEDGMPDGSGDEYYEQAISFIREQGKASASMLQRRFKVGYNRAASMIDAMESQGLVGPAEGAKPREVIY